MRTEPISLNRLKLPDPAEMSVNDLRNMFLVASEEFSKRLENCRDVDELRELQAYIKIVSQQIQDRDELKD
jgi:hypothetical protein